MVKRGKSGVAARGKLESILARTRLSGFQETLAGYVFTAPALMTVSLFMLLPILSSFVLVFMEYDILTPPRWAGLSNITRLFGDRRMMVTYWNTFRFALGATFLNNLLGLLLAMGVNRAMPRVLKYLLRTALFFPAMTTVSSLALVWHFILTLDRGIMNYLLQQIGLPAVPWLTSQRWALPSLIMFDVWRACGYLMILYLAGLQGIPKILYEAAMIDGANRWQLRRYVTLPQITPTAFFCITISLINAFQLFDNAWVLTEGGPHDASRLVVLYVYEVAFRRFEMGYASAVSLSLFALVVGVTLLQFWGARKWVHYD